MKFQVKRVENFAVKYCHICGKRMYSVPKKKTIFEIRVVTPDGVYSGYFPKYTCSNICANLIVLQGQPDE